MKKTVFFCLPKRPVGRMKNVKFGRLIPIALEVVISPIFGKNPLKSEAKNLTTHASAKRRRKKEMSFYINFLGSKMTIERK
jgi:hypothetical protein